MIGTSDGEQYEDSFAHTIATMPPQATEKPAGALKTDLGTQVADNLSQAPQPTIPLPRDDPRKYDPDNDPEFLERYHIPKPPIANPIVDGKYDKLPMSDNVEDRRGEIADMARNSKTIEELIDKISAMHISDPEEAKKYFKEMIKEESITDPVARKAGILDLIHQLTVLNKTDK